jgi:hypothetical protein
LRFPYLYLNEHDTDNIYIMTILFVPYNKKTVLKYLCLDKQKKVYLNSDVIRHIIGFLPIDYITIYVENHKELVNILENKYQNFHFIRNYKADEITYSKPKKMLYTAHYLSIRTVTGNTYSTYIKRNQTWGDVKKTIQNKYDIPFSKQKIIVCGNVVYNNQVININYINSICCVHLVLNN